MLGQSFIVIYLVSLYLYVYYRYLSYIYIFGKHSFSSQRFMLNMIECILLNKFEIVFSFVFLIFSFVFLIVFLVHLDLLITASQVTFLRNNKLPRKWKKNLCEKFAGPAIAIHNYNRLHDTIKFFIFVIFTGRIINKMQHNWKTCNKYAIFNRIHSIILTKSM
jgi:hypothetical protein